MGLPLFLAMNAAEIARTSVQTPIGWMACHFSPCSQGLTNFPLWLPEGSMLIIDDLFPCQGHSPSLAAAQIRGAVGRLNCDSVLLDFQRPENRETRVMIEAIQEALTCPVAVSHIYGIHTPGPVFLPPCPLCCPLEAHLAPWEGREIWMEVSLAAQRISVTEKGTDFSDPDVPDNAAEGFYDDNLQCRYRCETGMDRITFTLFDTPETLERKLDLAHSLGVTRGVGLWQQLRTFQTRK